MSPRSNGVAAKSRETASRPSRPACGHHHVGRLQGSHGTEHVKVSCDHLRPRQGTWSVEVRSLPSAWASASWRPLPRHNQQPRPGGTSRAAGVQRSSSATQRGTATGALCKQDTEARGPSPPSTAAPAGRKPSCSLSSLGHHLAQGSKGGGLWGHLGQRPAAEKGPDDSRGWRSVRWDSEC